VRVQHVENPMHHLLSVNSSLSLKTPGRRLIRSPSVWGGIFTGGVQSCVKILSTYRPNLERSRMSFLRASSASCLAFRESSSSALTSGDRERV
jgi:hypothetical protein